MLDYRRPGLLTYGTVDQLRALLFVGMVISLLGDQHDDRGRMVSSRFFAETERHMRKLLLVGAKDPTSAA
ncbi:hypothetical protein CVM73_22015 [Bradyrhizobium forestalis]|uniref:Uncharacterized protein n=1 Tax=Bradyrhizobium forestalis TaxID=1419263 RepID=A0A2M8R5G8_9BRAD|nr:hypothetical protein CVM73_22015 [Bradyrhizobium forestalis]